MRRLLADLALVAALLLATEGELLAVWSDEIGGLEPIAVALVAAPLVWRRRAPLQAALATGGVWLAFVAAGLETLAELRFLFAILLVAVYSVCAYSERREALVGWLAVSACVWGSLLVVGDDDMFWITATLMLAVPAVAGRAVRHQRAQAARLRELAERLDREREENERLAVVAERTRIARELHDVLAHSLSVMVLQADGGRQQVGVDAVAERRAFASIEAAGREALAESRRMLGVLRQDGDGVPLAPQPSLAALPMLVERTSKAGLQTDLSVEGEPRELAPGLELAAYRIVQEALTNAVRHSGAEHARVRVAYRGDALEIEVSDDGRGAPANGAGEPGHGLVGMRERAHLYGGNLAAGPGDHGGFRVSASLPTAGART